jgi:uncharacterized protein YkwD/uncharacterized membrane protein required for colicin V production
MSGFSLQGNYIDFLILLFVLYFIFEGFRVGFFVMFADFLSFLISLFSALFLYPFASKLLRDYFSISSSFSNTIGFIIVAVLSGMILNTIFSEVIKKVPAKFWKDKKNYYFSFIPALGESLVIVTLILTVLIGLPLAPFIKKDITESKIGGFLVNYTSTFNSKVNEIFGEAVQDTYAYLTVYPNSRETVILESGTPSLTEDRESEKLLFELVNSERIKRNIASLAWNDELADVGRKYARKMWEEKFFGHYSPEGDDVGDRLIAAGVNFQFAGENLALAPTVAIAHHGLMNSEGHRANILEINYKRVGIGTIDNGIYGKIFVQVFTN